MSHYLIRVNDQSSIQLNQIKIKGHLGLRQVVMLFILKINIEEKIVLRKLITH